MKKEKFTPILYLLKWMPGEVIVWPIVFLLLNNKHFGVISSLAVIVMRYICMPDSGIFKSDEKENFSWPRLCVVNYKFTAYRVMSCQMNSHRN